MKQPFTARTRTHLHRSTFNLRELTSAVTAVVPPPARPACSPRRRAGAVGFCGAMSASAVARCIGWRECGWQHVARAGDAKVEPRFFECESCARTRQGVHVTSQSLTLIAAGMPAPWHGGPTRGRLYRNKNGKAKNASVHANTASTETPIFTHCQNIGRGIITQCTQKGFPRESKRDWRWIRMMRCVTEA